MSCEIAPSNGDASVFGFSVKNETDAVRRLVAVCKQDDYLYPNLTAYEHLQLFAGLRGVPSDQIGDTVEQWLESVDLSIVQDDYSSSFSGGMKRRLSLACSTIGDRPVIILDEPTTGKSSDRTVQSAWACGFLSHSSTFFRIEGMDPVSRRFVWRHIDVIKDQGRAVLLTTHAMEEADLLADTVAVGSCLSFTVRSCRL